MSSPDANKKSSQPAGLVSPSASVPSRVIQAQPRPQASGRRAVPAGKTKKNSPDKKPGGVTSTSTPALNKVAPVGNTSKTNKLAQRRAVPLGSQKQKSSRKMIPQKVVNPPDPRAGTSPKKRQRLRGKISGGSHPESSDREMAKGGTKSKQRSGTEGKNSGILSDGGSEIELPTPIECWRCSKSAPAKIIGEPSMITHLFSFLLCICCLTPFMFFPYWCNCHTTPTRRCAHCGAYLTEPPPRD